MTRYIALPPMRPVSHNRALALLIVLLVASAGVPLPAANPLLPPGDAGAAEIPLLVAALDAWSADSRPPALGRLAALARRPGGPDRTEALAAVMRYLRRVPPERYPDTFDFLEACGVEASEASSYVALHATRGNPHAEEAFGVLAAIDAAETKERIVATLEEHRIGDRKFDHAESQWGPYFSDPAFFGALAAMRRLGPGAAELASALLPFVADPDPYVRRNVMEILAGAGNREAPVLAVLDAAFLGDTLPHLRAGALAALAALDYAAAEPIIAQALADGNRGFATTCAEALCEVRPADPRLVALLAELKMTSWRLEWDLPRMIASLDPDEGEMLLRAMAGHGEQVVRSRAVSVLEQLTSHVDSVVPGFYEELLYDLESDPDDDVAKRGALVRESIRLRLEPGRDELSMHELLLDLAEDDIPGNAGRALSDLEWRSLPGLRGALESVMRTGDAQQRPLAALLMLARFAEDAPPGSYALCADVLALRDFPRAVRRAIRVLCQSSADPDRIEERLARLEELCIGEDPQAARLAALCLQYDPEYEPQQFQLDLLAENLRSDMTPVNGTLALEILERGDRAGKRELLRDYSTDADVQAACLAALGLLGSADVEPTADLTASALGAMLFRTGIHDPVFARADMRLRELPSPEKVPLLEEILAGVDPEMRRWIAEILTDDPEYSPSDAVIDHWIGELRDDDVRWNAGAAEDALRRHDSPEVRRRLLAALDSDDRQQRITAEALLPAPDEDEACATPRRITVLMENLDGDNEYGNAGWKARWLIDHPPFALAELEAGLDSTDIQRRRLCAWILALRGDSARSPRIAEILIANLRLDFESSNAMMAVYGLARLGPAVRPTIEPLARDRDPQTAGAARMLLDYFDGKPSEEIIARNEAEGFRLGFRAEDNTRYPPNTWFY